MVLYRSDLDIPEMREYCCFKVHTNTSILIQEYCRQVFSRKEPIRTPTCFHRRSPLAPNTNPCEVPYWEFAQKVAIDMQDENRFFLRMDFYPWDVLARNPTQVCLQRVGTYTLLSNVFLQGDSKKKLFNIYFVFDFRSRIYFPYNLIEIFFKFLVKLIIKCPQVVIINVI